MKKKDLRDLRELSDVELGKKLEDERASLYDMKVKAKTGQMEKTADIKKTKRRIAVMFTEINARKLAAQTAAK